MYIGWSVEFGLKYTCYTPNNTKTWELGQNSNGNIVLLRIGSNVLGTNNRSRICSPMLLQTFTVCIRRTFRWRTWRTSKKFVRKVREHQKLRITALADHMESNIQHCKFLMELYWTLLLANRTLYKKTSKINKILSAGSVPLRLSGLLCFRI